LTGGSKHLANHIAPPALAGLKTGGKLSHETVIRFTKELQQFQGENGDVQLIVASSAAPADPAQSEEAEEAEEAEQAEDEPHLAVAYTEQRDESKPEPRLAICLLESPGGWALVVLDPQKQRLIGPVDGAVTTAWRATDFMVGARAALGTALARSLPSAGRHFDGLGEWHTQASSSRYVRVDKDGGLSSLLVAVCLVTKTKLPPLLVPPSKKKRKREEEEAQAARTSALGHFRQQLGFWLYVKSGAGSDARALFRRTEAAEDGQEATTPQSNGEQQRVVLVTPRRGVTATPDLTHDKDESGNEENESGNEENEEVENEEEAGPEMRGMKLAPPAPALTQDDVVFHED